MSLQSKRRSFLKLGTGAAGAALLLNPMSKALAAACGLTPAQTPGPFYPGENKFHVDNDLTAIPGHAARAAGQVVYVKGKVLDQNCNPVENANVEIWQACHTGKYNNSGDSNTAVLDPNFKYCDEVTTDKNGEYSFKTILPGAYPADVDWTRPPHIHFKITRLGYVELVTQMYFKGNQFNDRDLILQQIPANERDSVIVDFKPSPLDLEPGSLLGNFDITIQSVRPNRAR
jgi:protocatechuate 3,4-dioxygenase beta subunit